MLPQTVLTAEPEALLNQESATQDGKEDSPLDAKSPCWIEIKMVSSDGITAKTIPLKAGYFDLQLPKAFFVGNPKSITLNWIDFYRN
jgi:hypothetical protein